MIKACIFDMDGTLANTIDTLAYFSNLALSTYNLPSIETEKYKYFVGNGYLKQIENMFNELGIDDKELYDKVAKTYDEIYNKDYMYRTVPYDGIIDMLNALKAEGYKIGIASNKPHHILLNVVGQLFPGIQFDGVMGGNAGYALKPAPDMIDKLLSDFGVTPEECAYFGDTKTDMLTGRGANLNTVGVLWGFRKIDELTENGAQYIISHPSEILPLIKEMNVESFSLDHTKVKAPFVRKCTSLTGKNGDVVTKFDIRFTQPNVSEMESDGIHTLEHLLATYLRDYTDDIIDLSPMGCRTGFYMTVWGTPEVNFVIDILHKALKRVLDTTEIPAQNEIQCGNYKLHSLEKAKTYATDVLKSGFSDKFYR